jgi:hypothetical protein
VAGLVAVRPVHVKGVNIFDSLRVLTPFILPRASADQMRSSLINSTPGAAALHEVRSVNVSPVGCKEVSPCVMPHLKLDNGSFAAAEMPPGAARQLASMLQGAAERAESAVAAEAGAGS